MGTRISRCDYCPLCWDHPHACGDKLSVRMYSQYSPGSSPRVWGQVPTIINAILRIRIIPTRVGTSSECSRELYCPEDHPHACGDKASVRLSLTNQRGSSPRVWGQDVYPCSCPTRTGIIPTRVGTRKVFFRLSMINQDHPHACGDKRSRRAYKLLGRGSSPRVWGQALVSHPVVILHGIIPTRVGTSCNFNYCFNGG